MLSAGHVRVVTLLEIGNWKIISPIAVSCQLPDGHRDTLGNYTDITIRPSSYSGINMPGTRRKVYPYTALMQSSRMHLYGIGHVIWGWNTNWRFVGCNTFSTEELVSFWEEEYGWYPETRLSFIHELVNWARGILGEDVPCRAVYDPVERRWEIEEEQNTTLQRKIRLWYANNYN